MSEKNIVQEQGQTPVQRVRNDWKTLVDKISYNAIVSNIPYLAFVALLCVLYINNTQRAIEMQRELNQQNKILKELRWKHMDISTQLMNTRMETQVIRNAAVLGLKPLTLPAYTIQMDSAANKTLN